MSLIGVCRRIARRTFGIERLRRQQETAMIATLEGTCSWRLRRASASRWSIKFPH